MIHKIQKRSKTIVLPMILALIPATSGNSRGEIIPYLKISDLLSLTLLVYLVFHFKSSTKLIDSIGTSLVIYAVIGLSTSVININERSDISGEILVKSLLAFPQYLLVYLISFWASQKEDLNYIFLKYSVRISAIISTLAIIQFFDLFGIRQILSTYTGNSETGNFPEWKTFRSSSVFYSWHALSLYLSINFYFGVSLLRKKSEKFLSIILLVIILLGITTCLTFAPTILCLIALLKWRFINLIHVFYFAFGVIAVFGFQASQGKNLLVGRLKDQFIDQSGGLQLVPQTIAFRFKVWNESIFPVILDNIWTGYGFSVEGTTEFFRYSESMYLYLLLSGGVFLLLGFLFMQILSYKQLKTDVANQRSIKLKDSASMLKTLITWLMIISLIHPYLSDTGPAFLYFILLGLHRGNLITGNRQINAQ